MRTKEMPAKHCSPEPGHQSAVRTPTMSIRKLFFLLRSAQQRIVSNLLKYCIVHSHTVCIVLCFVCMDVAVAATICEFREKPRSPDASDSCWESNRNRFLVQDFVCCCTGLTPMTRKAVSSVSSKNYSEPRQFSLSFFPPVCFSKDSNASLSGMG